MTGISVSYLFIVQEAKYLKVLKETETYTDYIGEFFSTTAKPHMHEFTYNIKMFCCLDK